MPEGRPPPTQPLCCGVSHSALVTREKSPPVVMATQGWIWSLWFEPNRATGSLHELNAAWFPGLAMVSWRACLRSFPHTHHEQSHGDEQCLNTRKTWSCHLPQHSCSVLLISLCNFKVLMSSCLLILRKLKAIHQTCIA